MPDRRRWYIAIEWVQATHTAIARECERLENTIRYRLGAGVLELLSTPWRPIKTATKLVALVGEKGRGFQPIELDPMVVPPPNQERDETVSLRARSDTQNLWFDAHRISHSRAYTLGVFLIELRKKPWAIWRFGSVLWRVVREKAYIDSTWCVQPVKHISPCLRPSAGVDAILGPDWLVKMASYEDISRLSASSPVSTLLIGVEVASLSNADEVLRAARTARCAGTKVAMWLLGGRAAAISDYRNEWFADVDVVFTESSDDIEPMKSCLSIPVIHLPPAVQPRLQNPTGQWPSTSASIPSGGQTLAAASHLLHQLPATWGALEPIAQGQVLSPAQSAAVASILGEALPADIAPEWLSPAERDRRDQFLRSHHIMKHHCVATRLEKVGAELCPGRQPLGEPLISVIVCTRRPDRVLDVLDAFERQTHPNKELIMVVHGEHFRSKDIDAVLRASALTARWIRAPSKLTLGECVQRGFEESEGDLIVKFDDDDWYGKLFLETQLQACEFSFAGVVGKGSHVVRFEADASMYYFFPGREYRYMELFGGNRLLVRREVHEEINWRALDYGEDTAFIRDCLVNSVPMYSADGYHCVTRRAAPSEHTWQVSQAELLATHRHWRLPDAAGLQDFDPEPVAQ